MSELIDRRLRVEDKTNSLNYNDFQGDAWAEAEQLVDIEDYVLKIYKENFCLSGKYQWTPASKELAIVFSSSCIAVRDK